jgi:hypothetical protein
LDGVTFFSISRLEVFSVSEKSSTPKKGDSPAPPTPLCCRIERKTDLTYNKMSYYTAIVTPILNDYLHWDGRRAAYAALIQEVEQDPNWVDEEDPNYTREEKLQGCYDALMEAEEQVADLDAQIQAALQAAHEQNSALQAQLNQLQAAG